MQWRGCVFVGAREVDDEYLSSESVIRLFIANTVVSTTALAPRGSSAVNNERNCHLLTLFFYFTASLIGFIESRLAVTITPRLTACIDWLKRGISSGSYEWRNDCSRPFLDPKLDRSKRDQIRSQLKAATNDQFITASWPNQPSSSIKRFNMAVVVSLFAIVMLIIFAESQIESVQIRVYVVSVKPQSRWFQLDRLILCCQLLQVLRLLTKHTRP
jgi:hypothetical protein